MKLLIFFSAISALCYCANLPQSFFKPSDARAHWNNLKFKQTKIPADVLVKIQNMIINPNILKNGNTRDAGSITAVINEYADRILENIDNFIVEQGYDPLELPNEDLDFIIGSIKMTNGWLTQLETLTRHGDVIVSYSDETKRMTFTLPLEFTTLLGLYDYVTKVTLLTFDGTTDIKVDNVRIDLVLGFDFNTYQAALDSIDITDTGKISVHFTGDGLVDTVLNAMTDIVTLVLHPIILAIAEMVVKDPAEKIVDTVNEIINSVLHPTTPTTVEQTTETLTIIKNSLNFRDYHI